MTGLVTEFNYAGRCRGCGMALWRDRHGSRRLYGIGAGREVLRCSWWRRHRL